MRGIIVAVLCIVLLEIIRKVFILVITTFMIRSFGCMTIVTRVGFAYFVVILEPILCSQSVS